MLSINCLLNNKSIQAPLKSLVQSVGYELAAAGRDASIENVYNALRKQVEVDIQTVAALYADSFDLNDTVFSSAEELEEASDNGLKQLLNKQADKIKTSEIGRDNPVVSVVKSLVNSVASTAQNNPTIQRLMTDKLKNAAQSALRKNGLKNAAIQGRTSEEILSEALALLNNNEYYGLGLMESSQKLWQEFQKEFDKAADEADRNNHFKAQEIRQYADVLKNGTFQLLMSTPEVRSVITEALKQGGYSKQTTKPNGTTQDVVDWNKLFNDKSKSFETILTNALSQTFTPEQIDIISNNLKQEFDDILKDRATAMLEKQKMPPKKITKKAIVEKIKNAFGLKDQTGEFFLSQGTKQEAIREIIKKADNGKYTKIDKYGDTVIDWQKITNDRNFSFEELANDFLKSSFNATELAELSNNLKQEFDNLIKDKKETILERLNEQAQGLNNSEQKSAINRLLNLYNLGIFENAQQDALMKAIGVEQPSQALISSVKQVMAAYNKALQDPMAKWSPLYIRSLERQMQVLIDQFEDVPTAIKVLKKIGYYTQWSNAAILSNPQNILQNTLSGLSAAIDTAVQNPLYASKMFADFGNKWLDFSKGGVRVGSEQLNAFNTNDNLEDTYNAETKKGKRPDVIATALPRILLGAADNGFKNAMMNNIIVDLLQKELVRQGATKQQARMILNEAYYGNNEEINKIAKKLSANLSIAGLNVKSTEEGGKLNVKEKVIAAELALANMLTEGKFFQDLLNQWVVDGKISEVVANNINLDEGILEDIRAAAYSTSSKALGHEADNILVEYFGSGFEKLNKTMADAKKENKPGKYFLAKFGQLALGGINKFRQGSLAWTYLGLQKASGLALLQTVITDIALPRLVKGKSKWTGKGAALRYKDIDFTDTEKRGQALKEYKALRQRLVRESFGALLSYAGAAAVLAMIKGGGDDDEQKKRLLETKKYLDNHSGARRWLQMAAPNQFTTYMELVNEMKLDQIPGIGKASLEKLEKANIQGVNLENADAIAKVLDYNKEKTVKLKEAIKLNNAQELPTLLSLYYSLSGVTIPFKQTAQPNPLVQAGVDMFDVRKPDKAAVAGQFIGNVFNVTGFLKSYDIWKNSVVNPEKIQGEYKLIKPNGFWEGVGYSTLNKGAYKTLFKNDADFALKLTDYPNIGNVGEEKLNNANIYAITEQNLPKVKSILHLSNKKVDEIREKIKYHDLLIQKIKEN